MSFNAIRSTAYSALNASQVKTQIAAANIANADTQGYSVKAAVQVSSATGTIASGVSITAISSAVDKYLLADIISATSTHGAASVAESYADSLQNLYGATTSSDGAGTSLAQSITTLESALASLAVSPSDDTLKAEVVAALDAVASQLRETSAGVQGLRADADQEIADSIETVNTALETIASLNDQILSAKARGLSTADLEDQRNTELATVAEHLDVTYYVNSDGAMRVSTASGTTLVGAQAHTLSYSSAAAVTSETVFDAITVDGKDITAEIGSGKIGALTALRDETLVAAQEELDELAAGLIDGVNAAYATATTVPAPVSLTGSTAIAATDALSATGTLRIALTDEDGIATSIADLDLSAYATMGDLTDALDAIAGISATIDASGYLVITSDNASLGVSVAETDVAVGAAGEGLAAYLGLNDLLTGTDARSIAVDADILASPDTLATAALSADAGLAIGDTAVASAAATIEALESAVTSGHAFAEAGSLPAGTRSLASYAASMVAAIAGTATKATATLELSQTALATLTDAMASQTGVNLDEETAKLTELEQYYAVASQILSVLNDMFDNLLTAARSA